LNIKNDLTSAGILTGPFEELKREEEKASSIHEIVEEPDIHNQSLKIARISNPQSLTAVASGGGNRTLKNQ